MMIQPLAGVLILLYLYLYLLLFLAVVVLLEIRELELEGLVRAVDDLEVAVQYEDLAFLLRHVFHDQLELLISFIVHGIADVLLLAQSFGLCG